MDMANFTGQTARFIKVNGKMVVNTAKALYFRTENSTLAFGKMEQVYK